MIAARRWLSLALILACSAGSLAAACQSSSTSSAAAAHGQTEPSQTKPLTAPAPAAAAPRGAAQPRLPMGALDLHIAGNAPIHLKVEIAAADAERQKGLMFREQLGDDEGMLFLFPTERYNSFWMHNTLIPLDMIFIDAEWNVVGVVENAKPLTDDPRRVDRMSRYVLEVNAGFSARYGLGAGATVKFMPPQALELP
jgi:uncharacterized membrane protein (UPF0127 family)